MLDKVPFHVKREFLLMHLPPWDSVSGDGTQHYHTISAIVLFLVVTPASTDALLLPRVVIQWVESHESASLLASAWNISLSDINFGTVLSD